MRFEPGQRKEVTLVGFGGAQELTGLNDLTQGGALDDAGRAAALARARAAGFAALEGTDNGDDIPTRLRRAVRPDHR